MLGIISQLGSTQHTNATSGELDKVSKLFISDKRNDK